MSKLDAALVQWLTKGFMKNPEIAAGCLRLWGWTVIPPAGWSVGKVHAG